MGPCLAINKDRRRDIERLRRRFAAAIVVLRSALGVLLCDHILQTADARIGVVAGHDTALRGGLGRGFGPSDADAKGET